MERVLNFLNNKWLVAFVTGGVVLAFVKRLAGR